MKKSDLKTGMVVQYRNGEHRKVMLNTSDGDKLVSRNGHLELDTLNENLTHKKEAHDGRLDVVKVYETSNYLRLLNMDLNKYQLVWERPVIESVEITVKVNGIPVKLSDLSDETIRKIKERE